MKLLTINEKTILLKFNKIILLAHYTHLGFKERYLQQSYRKALLGSHNKVHIIDYSLTLSNLRFATNFLMGLMIKNNKVVFVFYEIPLEFSRLINFKGHYHIFNKWPAGLLTNSITTLTSDILKREGNFYPYTPHASFILANEPEKNLIVVNESNKLLLPGFCLADSNLDLEFFPYWIPANTKSGYSKLFFCFYINSLIKKADLTKKAMYAHLSRVDLLKRISRWKKEKKLLARMKIKSQRLISIWKN